MNKKVLIAHFRIGGMDGVSLEIGKRAEVLKRMGWDVVLLGGSVSVGSDYTIPEMEFDSHEINRIKKNAFHELRDFNSGSALMKHIDGVAKDLCEKIMQIIKIEKPTFMMLHNIFSHGRHIALAKAFFDVMQNYEIPVLATHHDFYWERPEYDVPTCPEVIAFLDKYSPPVLNNLRHATINRLIQGKFKKEKNIVSTVMPDTWNFDQPKWVQNEYNSEFLSDHHINEQDILLLQATRIVERKGIEIALDLVALLNQPEFLSQLKGKRLYNGKFIDATSKFTLLLAGYAEKDSENYLEKLKRKSNDLGLDVKFIGHSIKAERHQENNKKYYSLWDTYVYADAVTYPSIYEGWGNQFLEAVFMEKPIVLHEYPVFQSDILEKNYFYGSLGKDAKLDVATGLYQVTDARLKNAARSLIDYLLDKETPVKLRANFVKAKKFNSFKTLQTILEEIAPKNDGF